MDPDRNFSPPELMVPQDNCPTFSCFLDCCKPKKGRLCQEEEDDDVASVKKGLHEEVKVKGKMEKTKQETTSKAVVPSKNALSRKAVVEFLKMLLSFLLFQSMGKTGEPKSEESAKLNYEQVKEDREDVPILQR
ncbi:unnamed protein product [Cylindrotheca closterium]|uniref:Uncharacterized protein n=1 Tax=Cylindrotheca closterium TaxID=2856 RepID=A0AAD2PV49_9STRA|nr:unnamed protein product [Cylindrotheca closterium]